MTAEGKSAAGGFEVPRYGKDHLTLADWRTGVLQFQQPRGNNGKLPDSLATGFARSDGTTQQVILERGAASEFPTAGDEDVILGLIHLARQQGFPELIHFVPRHLLQIIRWPLKQQSYDRLRRALARYKKLSATFTGNWYDRQSRQIVPTLLTGIIAQAEIVAVRGRLSSDALPPSTVQFCENFNTSLKNGNLVEIDFDLLFSWRRPGAKDLHRHLNKVWHGGKKPRVYERDLRELACGHLGMKDSKDLKRNLQNIIDELEQQEYLLPLPASERYRKVAVGVWRVRLELHPIRWRQASRTQPVNDATPPREDQSRLVVRTYHRYRFGRDCYQPQPHELRKASALLESHSVSDLIAVTRSVVDQVRQQNKDDLYFGFAVPYYEQTLCQHLAHKGFRQRVSNKVDSTALAQSQSEADRRSRDRLREAQLEQWGKLSRRDRERLRDRAAARAKSSVVKRRIARCDLDLPATEVLAEIEHSPRCGVGEC